MIAKVFKYDRMERNFVGKFDGILICTDLDGTLLKNDKTVSEENIEAIEYFKKEGGLFTFVTGRMPYYIGDILKMIKPNAPIGCVNGGGLFDHIKGEYLWKSTMPESILEIIRCVDENFPDVGIQVCTFDKTYFSKENLTMERFRRITKVENAVCHYQNVKDPIAKIIFGSESDEELEELKKNLEAHPLSEEFYFIRSAKTLCEVLPKGISKGTTVEKICEKLGLDIKKTIALGDYNNDISMFEAAKIGIAVSNACEDALKAADFVTVSNEEHALAQVVCDLESGKYQL